MERMHQYFILIFARAQRTSSMSVADDSIKTCSRPLWASGSRPLSFVACPCQDAKDFLAAKTRIPAPYPNTDGT